MATLQLGEEVAHAPIRNLAGNDNIPDRNSIRGWASSLWLGWVRIGHSRRQSRTSDLAENGRSARQRTCRSAFEVAKERAVINRKSLVPPARFSRASQAYRYASR